MERLQQFKSVLSKSFSRPSAAVAILFAAQLGVCAYAAQVLSRGGDALQRAECLIGRAALESRRQIAFDAETPISHGDPQ